MLRVKSRAGAVIKLGIGSGSFVGCEGAGPSHVCAVGSSRTLLSSSVVVGNQLREKGKGILEDVGGNHVADGI